IRLLLLHAAARVEGQNNRDRLHGFLKQLELLYMAILEDLNVPCCQIQILTHLVGSGELDDRANRWRFPGEVAGPGPDDVLRIVRLDGHVSLCSVRCLIPWRETDQVAVLNVLGQHVVYFRELCVSCRKEEPPSSVYGELPQQTFALYRDAGHTADA